jgi:aspartate/methionine/tyrosine aminotransferase
MSIRLARSVEGRGITLIRRVFEGAPADCINLGLGQPTDAVPEAALTAIRKVLDGKHVPYAPTAGLPALRQELATRVYGDGDPSRILVTAGSQQALWVTLMGLVNPGEDVLIAEPGYPAYRMVTGMIGANPVPVRVTYEGGWKLDPAAVEAAWTPKTRALIVASPANPTGMFAGSQQDVERLARLCEERDAWLVGDEIYSAIRFVEPHRPLVTLGDRVVAIGGIAKAFAATGLRIGWIHARPEVIQGVMPLLQQVALCAPTLGQHAAIAALHEWGEPLFAELRERYGRRRAAMVTALRELGGVRFHEPEGAFYVLADVSSYATDTFELAMRLREEARVITAPGESFGPDCGGLLRLSFASEPEVLREGVSRIAAFLSKIGQRQ